MAANTAQKAIMAVGEDAPHRKPASESVRSRDQPWTTDFEHSAERTALEKAYKEISHPEGQLYEENETLAGERDHLRLLLDVNNIVVSTFDSHELLSAISSCLRRVIPHDYASLALYEPEDQQLRLDALEFVAGKDVMN
jgi:hypothetical protein